MNGHVPWLAPCSTGDGGRHPLLFPACSRPISRCWVRVSDYRTGAGLVGGPMPPYTPHAALKPQAAETRLMVVCGGSSTGKIRAACEAITRNEPIMPAARALPGPP